MSRVTAPIAKITRATRGISSSTHPARSSALLDSARLSAYLPRRLTDLKVECSNRKLPTSGTKAELVGRLAANDLTRSHSTLGGHRPATSQSPVYTASTSNFRFMQGFQTSAPKAASREIPGLDTFTFPDLQATSAASPFSELRVPLLPDNYNPDRSAKSVHAAESLDEAVPRPEITIVAAHPNVVLPAAMTEVVANEALEFDLGELTRIFAPAKVEETKEPEMVKEIWNSFLDDVRGAERTHKITTT